MKRLLIFQNGSKNDPVVRPQFHGSILERKAVPLHSNKNDLAVCLQCHGSVVEREADNLRQFRSHFGGAFWSALVSFPQPIEGLVSHDVLVESFEEGESVAAFLEQKDYT